MSSELRRLARRAIALVRHGRAEQELGREIDAHLQLLEDQFAARGLSREEARYAARRAFGGVEQAKERQRDARSLRWLAGWPMDLKLGIRMLVKTPGLTVIAVAALAVAIGAGAAFFELTGDLLSPSLNVQGTERLVGITAFNVERRRDETFRLRTFDAWRSGARSIEDLGASRNLDRDLATSDGRVEPVRAVEISASAFRLVPVTPVMGRTLTIGDERPGAPPVAVIGHDVWVDRYRGDPGVLGAAARLGSREYTIVGVMPSGFGFPVNANLWVPLQTPAPVFQIFGRLRPGVTAAAARAELASIGGARAPEDRHTEITVLPYLESFLHEDRGSFETLAFRSLNLVFIMLLAVCGANVATLVFARTAMREGEITVRTALGASRGRIGAQLFAEALVLSLVAAAVGLFAARLAGQWAAGLFEQGIGPLPFWWDEDLGFQTVAYALLLAVFAALIVGITPALKATGRQLQGRLRQAASGTSTMRFGGVWTGVIVTQAALTVAFLATVLALGWSTITRGTGDDVIYARDRLLTAGLDLEAGPGGPGLDGAAEARARAVRPSLHAIAARIRETPGVVSVTMASAVPGTTFEQFFLELQSPELQAGAETRRMTDELWTRGAQVGEDFFATLGVPIVSGRVFTSAEARLGAPLAVVDETFVRTVLGGRSPLGVALRERARGAGAPGPWLEIVGVVKDVSRRARTGPDDATVYRIAAQGQPLRLLVRTQGEAAPFAQRVYAAAREANPDARLVGVKTLAREAYDDAMPERIFLAAFSVISAIALLLATAGIYALVSFTLWRRTREIGIRIAIGAAPRAILRDVFARAFTQIGLGVLAGALPGVVILASIVEEAQALSTATAIAAILGVCVFVMLVALISCAVPLRRALNVDPITALRTDG